MAKKQNKEEKKPVVVLDDKEYEIENMADDQKVMLAHIQDLQRKIEELQFTLGLKVHAETLTTDAEGYKAGYELKEIVGVI